MTAVPAAGLHEQFQWQPQPEAQRLVSGLVQIFLSRNPGAQMLADQMKAVTATRFIDWIEAIHAPATDQLRGELVRTGFTRGSMPGAEEAYVHQGAMFPAIVLLGQSVIRVDIKVESVADFLAAWNLPNEIDGPPWSQLRRAKVSTSGDAELWVVERHGYRGFAAPPYDAGRAMRALHHLELFRRRPRAFGEDAQGFTYAAMLIDGAIGDLGPDFACDLFFQAERDYWQRRNRAALFQKARQDKLGLGWANHDHHTYRSSRENFRNLIACLERLGFRCRERFYAGGEAGWGAQVLEQPGANITIFADVDMSPDEVMGDFAHEGLPPRDSLGTVGLWCALHGEAFLQAGMHHLECQFDWHALKEQMERDGSIRTMDPFTAFPYLRQAFTEGERWPVADERVRALLDRGLITGEQAENFRVNGAIGSHLENLERNDGYKGFNQQGVSEIIAKTDPRKHQLADA